MPYKFPREELNDTAIIPPNVTEELANFGTRLGAITVGFAYGAIGIIIIALVWLLAALKFMTWMGALVLTIVILFFLYGSIVLYRTTMEYAITDGISKLNEKFDTSMPTIIQNVMSTLNRKEQEDEDKRKRPSIDELESSIEE